MDVERRIKHTIDKYAPVVSSIFIEAAKRAKSEEDVKQECNKILDRFIDECGLNISKENEYTTPDGGSIDTKYGNVLIEYKNPKSPTSKITANRDAPGTKAVIEQLVSRFEAFENEYPGSSEKFVGVGLDGDTIVYVTKRKATSRKIAEPYEDYEISVFPVTPESIKRLLENLASVAVRGKEFTPENLAQDFGAGSDVGLKCVRTLYNAILGTTNPKAKTLFQQWEILFGEVCGYDIEGKTGKLDELAKAYDMKSAQPAQLLFSVHTYYSIFMKLLAAEVINAFSPYGLSMVKKCCDAISNTVLRDIFKDLEDGSIWRNMGYTNFIEGNLFEWYVDIWDDDIADSLRSLASRLGEYDPTTLVTNPSQSRDLLKKLYHELFPRKVRHDLGEFYTPDWLAEYVLDELGYDGNPDKKILDPACGSGTFLVMAIKRIIKWYSKNRFSVTFGYDTLAKKIINNVIGFDLNPLAVVAARTNYLIAMTGLLRAIGGFEIPVYLCDSVVTPTQREDLFKEQFLELRIAPFKTPLKIPIKIAEDRILLGRYTELIDTSLRSGYSVDDFIAYLEHSGFDVSADEPLHRELYEKLLTLTREGKNGVWARVIKNAFAPVFVEKVDFIAGNPPWINWESLPEEYRNSTKILWENYGLFTLSGQDARLGGGKKDFSMIFTYSSVDNYLKIGGKLGFVITQSVFKTKGAGDGFRRMKFRKNDKDFYLKPIRVTDMSDFQPFEGATNRTAVFVCKKSTRPFKYPVPYIVWKKAVRGKISPELMLDEVKRRVKRIRMDAIPVDPENPTSPWLTAPKKAIPAILKVIGKSDYKAFEGVNTGGANGVYWIEVLKELPNGDLIIRNLANVGKKKVKQVEAVIEPDFVYPLLRGRDVQRWRAKPSCHIIMVHDPIKRIGYPEREMKIKYPKTYAYLKRFEDVLRRRAAYRKYFSGDAPFYTMYDVGPYTMAEWKVVWADMGDYVAPAVVSKERSNLVLPEHHVMFVSLDNPQEAHFICAVLSSSISMITSWAYTTSYGKSAHLVENISIPRFDPSNKIHLRLSELSRLCHEAAEAGDEDSIKRYEREIDILAAKIWGITDEELAGVWEVMER